MVTLPDRFINWSKTADGRKYPCDARGNAIDPHDPNNWRTYDEAAACGLAVGWVLNGDGFFFIDLDKCFDGEQWSAEADSIYHSFPDTLREVSQSGVGMHLIGRCDPTQLSDRRNKWDGWKELYWDKRFVALNTITGHDQFNGTDYTGQLLNWWPQREHLGELPDGRDPSYTGPEDDEELIRIMLRAKSATNAFGGGVTVKDLWEANEATLGIKYPDPERPFDHSAADAALMSHLAFWTGKDMPRMDRLFRRSALMRDKYERRADYRRDTIQNAARLCKRVYDKPTKPPAPLALPGYEPPSSPGGAAVAGDEHEAFLTIPEMQGHFKGCIYIRDNHRVLVPDGAQLKPEQFNATYGGHMFQMMPDGTKPTTEAFKALTQNLCHRFPQAKRACFRADLPQGAIADDEVNVYVKPDVVYTPGDVAPFLRFLERLLPDPRDREILLAWCAALVQNPGVKFQWAPVLQGVEGNGKSLIASCLSYCVGARYSYEPRASQLANQFMSFDENMILVVVEEIHMRGRAEMLDELKPRITNQRIEVEAKGQDKRLVRNTANWFFCTNYRDAVVKSKNDRRYAIFYTAQQSAEDLQRDGMSGNYFPELYRWLRQGGGYAAVGYWLQDYQIPDDLNPATNCHRAPVTTSTQAAISATTGGIEAEIEEAIDSETVGFKGGFVSSYALDKLLADKRLRASMPKRGEILRDMGYEKIGRAARPIIHEGATRPTLWRRTGSGGEFEDYLVAQGAGYC